MTVVIAIVFLQGWHSIIAISISSIFIVVVYLKKKNYSIRNYSTFQKAEKWLLNTVGGVLFLGWATTFINGKIIPSDFEKNTTEKITKLESSQNDIL